MSRWVELGERYEEGQIDKLGSGRVGGLMGFWDYYLHRASVFQKLVGSGIGSSYVYLGNKKYIHNDYAEILMGCGLIGFSLYAFILVRLFLLLKRMLRKSHPFWLKRLGAVAMSNFFIVLSFHMTNVTSGVIYLSVWAVFTGALVGIEEAYERTHWASLQQARPEST